jgi:glycine oxidase
MIDVLVIGAGVIGCASALALAKRGASVTVLERGVEPLISPGGGASWAAAGILGAQIEVDEDGPMARLCLTSRDMYAAWAGALTESTGIDVGYRRCGALRVALDEDDVAAAFREVAWQRAAQLPVETFDGAQVRALEPALSAEITGGVRFVADGRVDPPSLMRALRVAAAQAGARLRGGAAARRVLVEGGRARGVSLEDGTVLAAGRVVLAAGCWSALVEGAGLEPDAVRPARGQIVELYPEAPLLRHAVFGPACYFSPRDDGRVLLGSTTEFVGFSPGVTARAVRDLITAAIRLVPALGDAAIGRTWSGLRPHTADELPILGEGAIRNLIFATGHFRNGVLLAPITGEIVAAIATGDPPPVDLRPFSATRFRA